MLSAYSKFFVVLAIAMVCFMSVEQASAQGPPPPPNPAGLFGAASDAAKAAIGGVQQAANVPAAMYSAGVDGIANAASTFTGKK